MARSSLIAFLAAALATSSSSASGTRRPWRCRTAAVVVDAAWPRRSTSSFRSPRCTIPTTSPRSAPLAHTPERLSGLLRHRVPLHEPRSAQRFALPEKLHDAGVRRYGFHGCPTNTSPRRCADRPPKTAPAGPSSSPRQRGEHVRDGCRFRHRKHDGFTAVDAGPGPRSGSAILGSVCTSWTTGADARAIDASLHESGGLRLCISSDLRTLLASTDHEPAAIDLTAIASA